MKHFTTKENPAHNSRHWPAVLMETKAMIVSKDVYTAYLTTNAFPAIHARFQFIWGTPVTVQQDNAKLHFSPTAMGIASKGRHSIQLNNQSLNSPQLNILELDIFKFHTKRSIWNSHETDWWFYMNGTEGFWDMHFGENIWVLSDFSVYFRGRFELFWQKHFKIQHRQKYKLGEEEKRHLIYHVLPVYIKGHCNAMIQTVTNDCHLKNLNLSLSHIKLSVILRVYHCTY